MNYTTIHIVLTLLMMASLITLMIWAWGKRQRKHFDTAAQTPLEADVVLDLDVVALSRSHYEFPSPLAGEGQGEGDHISNSHMPPLTLNPSLTRGEGSLNKRSRS